MQRTKTKTKTRTKTKTKKDQAKDEDEDKAREEASWRDTRTTFKKLRASVFESEGPHLLHI
jgi:hypothetical protein